ncbi:MAG TPA: ABC transporter substrate-binding protein [Hyalangium sp.]|nr:ABC transporter substrate-binding protein [Hyalangium sp.]
MRTVGIVALSTALLAGCSFTTASGLTECDVSSDCQENQVCTNNFCLPLPAGCGQRYPATGTTPEDVQIGAVLPLSLSATDPTAGKDESEVQGLNAILLALDEINQRGVLGRKITLHVCDTAFDAQRTAVQTQWLVNEKKIVALLTAGSSQTLAAAKETLKNNVLTMSTSGTSPELATEPDKNGGTVGLLWRTAPSDVIQGKVIGDLLRNDSRFNTAAKIGVIYLNDLYGQGLFNVINSRLEGWITEENFKQAYYSRKSESSILTAVTQMDAFNPDLTVLVGFEDDATSIIKFAASSNNLKASAGHRWFFTDSVKDEALLDDATVLAQIQYSFGTAPATNVGQAFSIFRSRFSAQYPGVDPTKYSFTSHSYDAMYLLGLAMAYSQGTSNEVTGPKMAEGLTKMSSGPRPIQLTLVNFTEAANELANGRSIDVEGASGSLQFDDTGEAPSPIELWQVGTTTFNFVEYIPPPQ